MNRLLYGRPDPKGLANCEKDTREFCPECDGWGRIIFFADNGEQISEEDFRTKDYDREIMIEKCERCDGTGFIDTCIEEENPYWY